MALRRRPVRRPRLKACRVCGALNRVDSPTCVNCGSAQFTEDWEGMLIILDPEASELGEAMGLSKPMMFAIRVAGRVVVKGRPK